MKRSILVETNANSCYFRTSVGGDGRKALIQITERCNLHCAHCFVSSGDWGSQLSTSDIAEKVLPRLLKARVERITLTGGEPFAHPGLMDICSLIAALDLPLGICTNATLTTDEDIQRLQCLGNIHVNVSFDGFRPESHGKFRGSINSFTTTVTTTRKIAEAGLLQGLLSTPNALTRVEEFAQLCQFAVEVGAEYVLMNPLSRFGRGIKSHKILAADEESMRAIQAVTSRFKEQGIDLALIRFPNDSKPLGGCEAGKLIYVFVDGATAVCPYLVFAARSPYSKYTDTEFLVGNILREDVGPALDAYDIHDRFPHQDPNCSTCVLNDACGKGCPAAVISNGHSVGDIDREQCPMTDKAPLLQLSKRTS